MQIISSVGRLKHVILKIYREHFKVHQKIKRKKERKQVDFLFFVLFQFNKLQFLNGKMGITCAFFNVLHRKGHYVLFGCSDVCECVSLFFLVFGMVVANVIVI